MARFVHTGEPYINGNTLYWSATLEPNAEYVMASDARDQVDIFRMEANDPSGIDAHSTAMWQHTVAYTHDVMPGDTRVGSHPLDLPSGYYQIYLTIDETNSQQNVELRVSVHDGSYELKHWHNAA